MDLFSDAGNEHVTPELKEEILTEIKKTRNRRSAISLKKFLFKGERVNYSGTQNDKNIRLFESGALWREQTSAEVLSKAKIQPC